MAGQTHGVFVAVLDQAVVGCAQQLGERIVQRDARGLGEEFGKCHEMCSGGTGIVPV